MFHIALDTGILRKDPQRRSAGFRRLIELITDDQVVLHVPEVVHREFVSGIATEYRKHLNVAIGELNLVRRDFVDSVKRNLSRHLQELRKDVEQRCDEEFNDWLEQLNAHAHPVPDGAGARVAQSYFEGTPPFRATKSRDDFPDALIYETVRQIVEEVGTLHFIVEDGGLAKATAGMSGVVTHTSLDDFLVSTLDELSNQTDERLIAMLRSDASALRTALAELLPDALQGRVVRSRNIPDDNNEARLAGVYDPHQVSFDLDAADNLGGGYLSIPFIAAADVSLDYAIFIGDWAMLDDNRAAGIGVSELNDHYYEAEEDAQIELSGWLDVHVEYRSIDDEYITNAELREALANATFDLNEVDVTHVRISHSDPTA